MENENNTNRFIRLLTQSHRVILLGGLAVIGHGYNRPTKDADIWLDPMSSPAEWAAALAQAITSFSELSLHRLPGWSKISTAELPAAIEECRVVRVQGLDCPLDVFRQPNEFDSESFDAVYARGTRQTDGTILPVPIDLIQSKLDTGREKDIHDIAHLEQIVRADYKKRLPVASPDEARGMLERYSDWEVLQAALENPSQEIRDLAHAELREFAEAGDPFSLAILEGREIPYDR